MEHAHIEAKIVKHFLFFYVLSVHEDAMQEEMGLKAYSDLTG